MRLSLLAPVALLVLFVPRLASAQVNIEVVRRRVEDKPLMATLEAGFTGRLGNTRMGIFNASALGGAMYGPHRGFGQGTLDYVETNGKATVAKAFGHLRYNYALGPTVFGELFTQLQSDRFQKLQLRWLFGLGPRFLLVHQDEFDLSLGTSYMYEEQRLNLAPGEVFLGVYEAHRWNNFLSASYRIADRTEMTATVYGQPRLDDFTDVRALAEGSLLFRVTKLLVARMSIIYRFQSRPPPGVVESDIEVRNSLGITF